MNRRAFALSSLAAMISASANATSPAGPSKGPLVIAHRGASGYLPEHTLPAYEMAIRMGADFIEPDVVSTRDGHLVVRHDATLSDSTDIAAHADFADRKRTGRLDGIEVTDFFVCDFTLTELMTLRARQVFPDRDQSHNSHTVVTLQQVIDLAQAKSRETGRVIGICPELKHPSFHASLGLACEDKLLDMLTRAGLTRRSSAVIVQSFEQANLQYLRSRSDVRLLQLVSGSDADPKTGKVILNAPDDKPYDWGVSGRAGTYADMLTPEGLKEIATYADIVAPWKRWLLAFADGRKIVQPDIVRTAHAAGLKVATWTLRNDRLDAAYGGDVMAEYADLFGMGVDYVFSDFADTAVAARDAFVKSSGLK